MSSKMLAMLVVRASSLHQALSPEHLLLVKVSVALALRVYCAHKNRCVARKGPLPSARLSCALLIFKRQRARPVRDAHALEPNNNSSALVIRRS